MQKVFRGHLERKKIASQVRPKEVIIQEEKGDVELTLAIIKPDAFSKGYITDIKKRILDEGFYIVREKTIQLSVTSAEEFYEEHAHKPFYEKLTKHMSR